MAEWWKKREEGYDVAEYLEPGLRYTEDSGYSVNSHPVRYVCLWRDDEADYVSSLEIHSFKQRFGAVSIQAEGIGGVETLPQYRRRGYMRRLFSKALEGIAKRVDIVILSDSIEEYYEPFGFVSCLGDAHLTLNLRQMEDLLSDNAADGGERQLRLHMPQDLPQMVRLYNHVHANRPWTHERHADWNRLIEQEIWQPGSETLVLTEGEALVGYAVLKGLPYGRLHLPITVEELSTQDAAAARQLLAEVARRCWQLRVSEFQVNEPFDSIVGSVARQLGCQYAQQFPASGDMMAAILNRDSLLRSLEPELRRRAAFANLAAEHTASFSDLRRGGIVPDNKILVRLLLGNWSAADAVIAGAQIPSHHERVCNAWFSGGGSLSLPAPYAHKLDRY